MAGILDPAAEGLAGELPDRLDDPEGTAGRAGLADRQLATRRIQRKAAVHLETVAANEFRGFALASEAEVLDLHQADDRIIIIDLDHIDIGRSDTGHLIETVAIHRPAPAVLDRIVGKRIVPLDRTGEPGMGQRGTSP